MKKLILVFIFVLLASVTAFAQNISEYGKPSELKGVTKIYIRLDFAGGEVEMRDRDRIIKEIDKGKKKYKITNLEVVDKIEDAEVVLLYGEINEEVITGARTVPNAGGNGATTTVNRADQDVGRGLVVKPLVDGKMRLLMDVKNEQFYYWEKSPATSFGKEFIKAFAEANAFTTKNKGSRLDKND